MPSPPRLQLFTSLITLYLLISSTSAKKGEVAGEAKQSKGFWLSTDLLSVEFRKGCLSTALCHEPRFKLINTMTINGEQSLISWPASGSDMVQERARSFVTYWTMGDPEDVSLNCQIAGTDPSFGFSRTCDETPNKRIFNEATIQQTLTARPRRHESSKNKGSRDAEMEAPEGRMIVELRGRCFNATLAVSKHLKRCPWCPDPNVHIVVGGAGSQQSTDGFDQQRAPSVDSLFLHNFVILALSGAVVLAFTGMCCAVVIHCRYRQKHRRKSGLKANKQRLLKPMACPNGQPSHTHRLQPPLSPPPPIMHRIAEPMKGRRWMTDNNLMTDQQEQRYETPWENKYRPLPHWMTSSPEQQQMEAELALKAELAAEALLTHYDTSGSTSLACSARSANSSARSANSSAAGKGFFCNGTIVSIPPVVNNPSILHKQSASSVPFSPNTSITRHDDSGLESV